MTPVPTAVLEVFGLPAHGHPLPGGEGRSFRHGDAVLKPADDPAEAAWSARLLAGIEQRGFRLPRPLRARDGRWVVDGWTASEYLDGQAGPAGRWDELLAAGRAFHAALGQVPRPGFLDGRTTAGRERTGRRGANRPFRCLARPPSTGLGWPG